MAENRIECKRAGRGPGAETRRAARARAAAGVDLALPLTRLEVKAPRAASGPAGGPALSGLAAGFDNIDRGRDVVEPGAFRESLAELVRAGRQVPMLWQHDPARPIGLWDHLAETAEGLAVRGRLIAGVRQAEEARALVAAGAVTGLSIGFRIPPGGAEPDRARRVRRLKRLELVEISLVTFPMNARARIRRAGLPEAAGGAAAAEGVAADGMLGALRALRAESARLSRPRD